MLRATSGLEATALIIVPSVCAVVPLFPLHGFAGEIPRGTVKLATDGTNDSFGFFTALPARKSVVEISILFLYIAARLTAYVYYLTHLLKPPPLVQRSRIRPSAAGL